MLLIDRIRLIDRLFGENFEYSFDGYENTYSNLHFKCKTCGNEFDRRYNNATGNTSCPYCKGTREDWGNEWLEKKGKQIHGDKYDYSLVDYKGTDEKVAIICHEKDEWGDEHGIFYVTPHAHVGSMKSGCPKCSQKHKPTTEEFIKKARLVHGDKYDYSKVEYVRALSPVIITCPEHGDFSQKPNGHLCGQGCPHCQQSHIERELWQLFEEKGIEFKREYTPEWVKPLHIDFYLPEYNVAIECQGLQHYKPVKYYGGEEGLKARQERDERKLRLCEENGVRLLYYADYDFNFPHDVIKTKEELLETIYKIKQNDKD